jgi:hypothetical protein
MPRGGSAGTEGAGAPATIAAAAAERASLRPSRRGRSIGLEREHRTQPGRVVSHNWELPNRRVGISPNELERSPGCTPGMSHLRRMGSERTSLLTWARSCTRRIHFLSWETSRGQGGGSERVPIRVEVGLVQGVAGLPGAAPLALDATDVPAQVSIVPDEEGVVVRVPICGSVRRGGAGVRRFDLSVLTQYATHNTSAFVPGPEHAKGKQVWFHWKQEGEILVDERVPSPPPKARCGLGRTGGYPFEVVVIELPLERRPRALAKPAVDEKRE